MAASPSDTGLADIRELVAQHLLPALTGLDRAVDAGDLDGVRAYAFELAVDAAGVAVACSPLLPPPAPPPVLRLVMH